MVRRLVYGVLEKQIYLYIIMISKKKRMKFPINLNPRIGIL